MQRILYTLMCMSKNPLTTEHGWSPFTFKAPEPKTSDSADFISYLVALAMVASVEYKVWGSASFDSGSLNKSFNGESTPFWKERRVLETYHIETNPLSEAIHLFLVILFWLRSQHPGPSSAVSPAPFPNPLTTIGLPTLSLSSLPFPQYQPLSLSPSFPSFPPRTLPSLPSWNPPFPPFLKHPPVLNGRSWSRTPRNLVGGRHSECRVVKKNLGESFLRGEKGRGGGK